MIPLHYMRWCHPFFASRVPRDALSCQRHCSPRRGATVGKEAAGRDDDSYGSCSRAPRLGSCFGKGALVLSLGDVCRSPLPSHTLPRNAPRAAALARRVGAPSGGAQEGSSTAARRHEGPALAERFLAARIVERNEARNCLREVSGSIPGGGLGGPAGCRGRRGTSYIARCEEKVRVGEGSCIGKQEETSGAESRPSVGKGAERREGGWGRGIGEGMWGERRADATTQRGRHDGGRREEAPAGRRKPRLAGHGEGGRTVGRVPNDVLELALWPNG